MRFLHVFIWFYARRFASFLGFAGASIRTFEPASHDTIIGIHE